MAEIAEIVSIWTGIPAQELTAQEGERLLHLEEELHRRIVGQEEAVHAVSRAMRRSRVGLRDPERPLGSFLFLGPYWRWQNRAQQSACTIDVQR